MTDSDPIHVLRLKAFRANPPAGRMGFKRVYEEDLRDGVPGWGFSPESTNIRILMLIMRLSTPDDRDFDDILEDFSTMGQALTGWDSFHECWVPDPRLWPCLYQIAKHKLDKYTQDQSSIDIQLADRDEHFRNYMHNLVRTDPNRYRI